MKAGEHETIRDALPLSLYPTSERFFSSGNICTARNSGGALDSPGAHTVSAVTLERYIIITRRFDFKVVWKTLRKR